MKIFNDNKQWNEKVNFIDDNNVFLGYDIGQCCCEHADWYINDKEVVDTGLAGQDIDDLNKTMEGFSFDTDYKSTLEPEEYELDCGGIEVFKLIKGEEVKFLHIFNAHNGYYGHGFTFKIGDKVLEEGGL